MKRAGIDEIQSAIDDFTKELPQLQKESFNRVYALLQGLSLDTNGNIKPTIENLKIITRVKKQLGDFVNNPIYQDNVQQLDIVLSKVDKLQTSYFTQTFKDFTKPKTVPKLQELAFDSTIDQLAGAGIQENVVNLSADIVEQHIRDGSNFHTLVDELKVKMVGNKKIEPRLVSYAKQVINDTLSSFSRNYNNLVTDDLGLEWYEYIGALVDTSRPMCIVLVEKKYIHKSELAGIARGVVDREKVSTEGFMPGTTGENFVSRCCGYNCSHQCIPVPSVVVPQELRDKYENRA